MPLDDVEKLLKSMPVRLLAPAAEDEVVRRIRAVGARTAWWQRPIPLWQAAAVCLVIAAATGGVIGISLSARPDPSLPAPAVSPDRGPARKTVFVKLDRSWFPESTSVADRLDISTWTLVHDEKNSE